MQLRLPHAAGAGQGSGLGVREVTTLMAARTRTRRRGGARRNDRPQPCQRCRAPIVWATVLEPDGRLRTYPDGRIVHVPLNAEPTPVGRFEYVRGPVGRPVVRELDEMERLLPVDADRFMRHYDTPSDER